MIVQQQAAVRQPAKRRFWRFSLKTLFVLVTLFCIWFGLWAGSANRQRHAVEAIEQLGGKFKYDYQRIPSRSGDGLAFSYRVQPPEPIWLRRILGDHYFITPLALQIDRPAPAENPLVYLDALPDLESVNVSGMQFTPNALVHLQPLTKLRYLTIRDCTFSDRGPVSQFAVLEHLTGLEVVSIDYPQFDSNDAKHLRDLENLRLLFIYRTAIRDEGLAHFQRLKNLERLGLSGAKITDRGIAFLSNLPKLQYLSINDTEVSDLAFEPIVAMKALQEIELSRTNVTKEGIRKLRQALPGRRINGEGGPEVGLF
jgi:hypothetical protein